MNHFVTYEPRRINISLTPLIDVVFILLVFFMLTSTFIKDWVLPFKVPELLLPDEVHSGDQKKMLDNILLVLPLDLKWQGEITSLDQIIDHLGRDQEVILMADYKTDIARFVNIMDALRRVPGLKVQMVAQPEMLEERQP